MIQSTTSFVLALVCRLRGGGVIINGHTLTRSQVRRQLEVLGRQFDFIRLEELPRRLSRPTRRRFCLLTFDDGKHSNFTEIAPELEARRVPAVFYVTTGPLSTGAGFWFDRRDQLVKQLGHCPAGLELPALKKLPFDLLTERLEQACVHHGFAPASASDDTRPMSWDEARDLARRGFAIGAHGMTHAILTNEKKTRAFEEIEGSLAKVSAELGAPCTTIAFPNGNYTPELAEYAMRCGATSVMTTEPTWVSSHSPFWRLPRIQLFGETSPAKIELKIALAALRGVLANPDGSGRAYCAKARQDERGVRIVAGPERERGKEAAPELSR